jgi:predicted GTPase
MAWNPQGFPSPAELGYTKGARVVNVYNGVAYLGVVQRVLKESIVVKDDRSGNLIKSHPCAGFMLLVDATQDHPSQDVKDRTAEMTVRRDAIVATARAPKKSA